MVKIISEDIGINDDDDDNGDNVIMMIYSKHDERFFTYLRASSVCWRR